MYYLEPNSESIFTGTLYRIEKGQRKLVKKDFSLAKESSIFIKGAVICQWLTEGQTLELLDLHSVLPSKYEFFAWLEEEPRLVMLYEKAQFRRALTLTESLYDSLHKNSQKLDEKKLKQTLFALNELRKLVKNKDANIHTVINTRVIVPPFMDKWYKPTK